MDNAEILETLGTQEEFEDTKEVIRIRISKNNRQHKGQMKKYKRTNNNLQNYTYKAKDRVTRTPLTTGGELRCSGTVNSSCSTSGTRTKTNKTKHNTENEKEE